MHNLLTYCISESFKNIYIYLMIFEYNYQNDFNLKSNYLLVKFNIYII